MMTATATAAASGGGTAERRDREDADADASDRPLSNVPSYVPFVDIPISFSFVIN